MTDEEDTGNLDTVQQDVGSQPTIQQRDAPEPDGMLKARVRRNLFDSGSAPSIGRFTVLEEIGRGGMGVVYRARDPKLDRDVALKLLSPEVTHDEISRSRLQREARAMARVKHPHVAVVYEVGDHEDATYIAMELVEGPTLRGWLSAERGPEEIISVFEAVGDGLAAAHEAGLVHRDFKPDNVLVGGDGRPRVVDFGLASPGGVGRARVDDSGVENDIDIDASLTLQGVVAGTPAYMAPEQFRGDPTDARTDQFAYCIALWEALHGRRPYEGWTYEALREAVVGGSRLDPTRSAGAVARRVQPILDTGLSPDPGRRFDDMRQLLAQLEASRSSPTSSRRKWIALGSAGALLLAIWAAYERASSEDASAAAVTAHEDRPGWEAVVDAAALPPVLEDPLPDDPTKVTIHRLDNGLTVYLCPRNDVPSIHAQIVIRSGSGEDPPGWEGLSLLLARTTEYGSAQLGTIDWDAERVIRDSIRSVWADSSRSLERRLAEVAALEGEANAFVVPQEYRRVTRSLGIESGTEVHHDSTRFLAQVPASYLESWLRLEAERLRAPAFRGVLGELHARRPEAVTTDGQAYDAALAALYPDSAYAHAPDERGPRLLEDTIGQLEALHDRSYVPTNAAIVLVGDVDRDTVLPLIEETWGDWKAKPPPPAPGPVSLDEGPEGIVRVVSTSSEPDVHSLIAWRTPRPTQGAHPAYVAANSLLANRLMDRVNEFGFVASLTTETGATVVTLMSDETSASKAVDLLRSEIEALAAQDLDVEGWVLEERADRVVQAEDDAGYAYTLADVYVERLPWSDRVGRLEDSTVTEDAIRAALVDSARRMIAIEVTGSEDDPVPVPSANEPARAAGSSAFAASLAASSGAPPEPQFLAEGRHFWQREGPGGKIIAARCERGVEHLQLRLDLSRVDPPDRCPATFVAGLTWMQNLDLEEGTGRGKVSCTGTSGVFELSMREGYELLGAFDDPATWFETGEQRDALERTREGLADGLIRSAMNLFIVQSSHAVAAERLIPDEGPKVMEYFSADAPLPMEEQLRAWATIVSNPITVTYCGPQVEKALAEAPIDAPRRAPTQEPKPWRPHRAGVVAVEAPGPAVATIILSTTPDANAPQPSRAMAQVIGRYIEDQIRDPLVTHTATEAAFELDAGIRRDIEGAPATVWIQITSDAASMQRALEVVAAVVADPKVAALDVERARAEVEQDLRLKRIKTRDIPGIVLDWDGESSDPRWETWSGLRAVTPQKIQELLDAFRGRPLSIALSGPIEEIGTQALAGYGPLTVLPPLK